MRSSLIYYDKSTSRTCNTIIAQRRGDRMTSIYDLLIKDIAKLHNLPWILVKAICYVESGFNPWAVRYEPNYKWIYGDQSRMSETEKFMQKCSFGMLQVMGAVAREYGFTHRYLTQLCEPKIGIEYGCKHLAYYYAKYNDYDKAIVSYNAGSPRRDVNDLDKDGNVTEWVNQQYLDKVKFSWKEYEG